MINQGTIADDYTYVYTCRQCAGRGMVHGEACSHCYAGDIDTLLYEFAVARGERYYALLKRILAIQGKALCEAVDQIRLETGKFTPVDLATVLLAFNWPENRMKPLAEWLEECRLMPSGMYSHLKDIGMKPSDVIRAAKER